MKLDVCRVLLTCAIAKREISVSIDYPVFRKLIETLGMKIAKLRQQKKTFASESESNKLV